MAHSVSTSVILSMYSPFPVAFLSLDGTFLPSLPQKDVDHRHLSYTDRHSNLLVSTNHCYVSLSTVSS